MIILDNPPAPGTPEWQTAITASKVAAILGVSPWQSPYSLWVDMTQGRPELEPTAPMLRGTFLEDGILAWFEHDNPSWERIGTQLAVTQPDMQEWAFATLDGLYKDDLGNTVVVEVKTASRLDDWQTEDGGIALPAYYESQVRFQLALTDTADYATVVLLTPFLEKKELIVERDDEMEAAIMSAAHDWKQALDTGQAPDLDDTVATYDAVRREHPEIDPDKTVEIDQALAHQWLQARADLKGAEKRERGLKTKVLDLMGDAKTAQLDGLKIATRTPGARGTVTLRANAKTTDITPF